MQLYHETSSEACGCLNGEEIRSSTQINKTQNAKKNDKKARERERETPSKFKRIGGADSRS